LCRTVELPRFGQAHSKLPSSQVIGRGNENLCGRKRAREIAATGRIRSVIMLACVEEVVDVEINRPTMKHSITAFFLEVGRNMGCGFVEMPPLIRICGPLPLSRRTWQRINSFLFDAA
jgi:hypothetical protein